MNLFIHELISQDGYQIAKEIGNLRDKHSIEVFLTQRHIDVEQDEEGNIFLTPQGAENISNVFHFYKLPEIRF